MSDQVKCQCGMGDCNDCNPGGGFDPQAAVKTERIPSLQIVRIVTVPRRSSDCNCGEADCCDCGN